MKAYSRGLRQKILRACDQCLGSPRAIVAPFGVSQSYVEKLLRRRGMTGDIARHTLTRVGSDCTPRSPGADLRALPPP